MGGGRASVVAERAEEWVGTLHRWFDHWLYGIDSGINSQENL